ncbi:hypothetical protein AJ79_04083 [Helicocarpus griseus UAMH5409]|uniref:Uncharacterized protein n=1 Tax=Helicocarpus griseus UAMH5409 TaxID=1447875 RepID=A0A2B7XVB8_9EURO|nr:hypothetical protein AJ79_04083 [Helicocarpus griseus UAMH5409]
MEDPQTLTVATTWKFDKNAASQVRKLFKSAVADVGFCMYEHADDIFVVDNCDVIGSAPELGRVVAKFIEDEKDNDLMEIPKVSRLGPPNAANENAYGDDTIPEPQNTLIDIAQVSERSEIPFTIKYWKSETGTTGPFGRMQYIIDGVAKLSGAEIFLEEANRRLRVSSYLDNQVNDALNRLSNLQTPLTLSITPQVSHILNVSPQADYRLKLPVYSELNRGAINRILVDPDTTKIAGQYHKMFATVMVIVTPDNRDGEVPLNLREPPRATDLRKGRSKLWAEFKYQGLGDPLNNHQLGGNHTKEVAQVQQSQVESSNALPARHPFLTREKTTLVDKWVAEGVEAGAVGADVPEPNSMSPQKPSAESAQPALPPGIKRRKAVAIDANGVISTPVETSNPLPAVEVSQVENDRVAFVQQGPPLPANFNASLQREFGFPFTQNNSQQRSLSPRPAARQQSPLLIDLSDETPAATTSALPPMSSFQIPLIPSKPAEATPAPKIREPEVRVFRRTMGQKAANKSRQGNGGLSKEERDAKIAELWGTPAIPPKACTPNPSIKSAQPSEWKKAQQAKGNEKYAATVGDFLHQIGKVLDGVRCFPGAVTFGIELGLILVSTAAVPKQYTEGIFDTKVWSALFQPKNNLIAPGTVFTNMLTTSGADVDYILNLVDRDEASKCPLFSEEVLSRRVWYEFYCTTKNNETLVVTVDESGTTVVNRPESMLGAVNIHCADHIWDMRGVVKGTIEYTGDDEETDEAIQTLINKLYIEPNRSRIKILTQFFSSNQLKVKRVLVKRSTRHRFHLQKDAEALNVSTTAQKPAVQKPSSSSGSRGNEGIDESSHLDTPSQNPGPILQVTEVQSLRIFKQVTDDGKTLIRAVAASADEMVNEHRLWYEVSITNLAIEEMLHSNKYLEFGDRSISWFPFDQSQTSNGEGMSSATDTGPVEAEPVKKPNRTPLLTTVAEINSKDVSEMFCAANKIVQEMDGVGWANIGCEYEKAQQIGHGTIAPSVIAATSRVPTEFARLRAGGLAGLRSVNGMESASVRNAFHGVDVTEGEFW